MRPCWSSEIRPAEIDDVRHRGGVEVGVVDVLGFRFAEPAGLFADCECGVGLLTESGFVGFPAVPGSLRYPGDTQCLVDVAGGLHIIEGLLLTILFMVGHGLIGYHPWTTICPPSARIAACKPSSPPTTCSAATESPHGSMKRIWPAPTG